MRCVVVVGICGGAKRARAAYEAARHVYENRDRYTDAARKIHRAYRKYKVKKPRSPLEARGERTTNVTGLAFGKKTSDSTLSPQTLYSLPVVLPRDDTDIGARSSNIITTSGIKWCYEFENPSNTMVELHFALVQAKATNSTDTEDLKLEFFRDTSLTASRTTSFADSSPLPDEASWSFNYKCLPINPDRFRIFFHKKAILGARDAFTAKRPWFYHDNGYMPWKQVLRFHNNADEVGNINPVTFVWWFTTLAAGDFKPTLSDNPHLAKRSMHQVYFKDGAK